MNEKKQLVLIIRRTLVILSCKQKGGESLNTQQFVRSGGSWQLNI